jgi:pyruvate/2-oxoglutarate dehydrogenase complex dihydrolipoamide acyltransferase (E2) component
MSLERVLALTGAAPAAPDLDAEVLLAAQLASRELLAMLASADDEDDDGKASKDGDEGGDGGEHSSHATFKALVKRNIPAGRAASMCAKSDKNVKATALARSLAVLLSGRAGIDLALVDLAATPASETAEGRRKAAASDHALPDGSYPIEDKKHLHSAAVLAASKHGDWKAAQGLIKRRAREMGVDVATLPGFGRQSDADGEKAAASMVALAAKVTGDGGVAMNHAPFTGTHTHTHWVTNTHDHPHQHVNDSRHDGGPLHRPGSQPRRGEMW